MESTKTALLLLLLLGGVLTETGGWAELKGMLEKARHRRTIIQDYFMLIYNGNAGLCAPFPAPTTAEQIGEECLKGYNEGLGELSGKTLPQVQGLMRCQEGYFTAPERAFSIIDKCTAKGMEDGAVYWFNLIKNKPDFQVERRILSKQRSIEKIIRKLWSSMIAAKGAATEVVVHSKVVSIPKGLFCPNPEGIMQDYPVTTKPAAHELTANTEQLHTKQSTFTLLKIPSPQKTLFLNYIKQLEQSDPSFQRSLSEDPQYKCQNNRIYTYHETVKSSLAKCEGILDFEQKAIRILSDGESTLEELEFLNRVLFDVVQSCGVTNYALQEQNNPSLMRYTDLRGANFPRSSQLAMNSFQVLLI